MLTIKKVAKSIFNLRELLGDVPVSVTYRFSQAQKQSFPFFPPHVSRAQHLQGVKLIFFSDRLSLGSQIFKVVTNSKKLVAIFKDKQNFFFYAVSVLDRPTKIKFGKRSFMLQSGH